jgi:photosystem II stability/assembly factor-like uncharacterized protein
MKRYTLVVVTLLVVGFCSPSQALAQSGWQWQNPLPQGHFLSAVKFINADYGWAVGNFGTIIHTTNGGTTWITQTSGTTNDLLGISFADANNGAASGGYYSPISGSGGIILHTTNGGTTWVAQLIDTTYWFNDISFTDANNGTATRADKILRTTNGGANWVTQLTNAMSELLGISFTNQNNGTVVGSGGTILRTTNGGTNWVTQTSGTTNDLLEVSFTDANNGTAVGHAGAGTILRTTNGGTTWITQTSGTTGYLLGVSFTDANNGTVVGVAGTILRTTNGGTTWVTQTSGTTNDLSGVSFTDANNGTVVGEGGTILHTTNGGTTWVAQSGVTFIGEERVGEVPTDYVLEQNYPNPFNPSTKISFKLQVSGFTTLKVYDMLGREVRTLVSEELKTGSYETTFSAEGGSASGRDASSLASGVYLYRLQAGDFVQTKKLVLLR